MSQTSIPVTAKASEAEGARSVTVNYDFGGDLTGAIEKFGEEVIFANFVAQGKINLQALIRRLLNPKAEEGKPAPEAPSDDAIQAAVDEWTPSNKTVNRKSAVEKLKDGLDKLSPEQRAELMKMIAAGAAD